MSRKILPMLVVFLALAGTRVTTASAKENSCENNKMYISNQITVNLWYKGMEVSALS